MKIGILTLPLHTNYGGILQAYALQTVLERMGHEVVVIDKSPYRYLKASKMPLAYSKRIIKKYVLRKNINIFSEKRHNHNYSVTSQLIQPFIDKYIHRIEVNDLTTLSNEDFDAIIVGSDQIWRPIYYPKIENAYLDFAKSWKIKKIAYAASFGTDEWEYTPAQTLVCADLIQLFNAVSVREHSSIKTCKDHFDIKADHVLDPTMLLSANDYMKTVKAANVQASQGTLLNYILDDTEEKQRVITSIANSRGLIPFRVNARTSNPQAPIEERIQPPVEQWLRGFHDAGFVITDSFHACVFSILFNKPFIIYANKERGMARFNSLLSLFDLEDRMITSYEDFRKKEWNNIDWGKINERLSFLKEASLNFLKTVLNE